MGELIISVSGLRGIVGETLTPEVAMRYACAFTAEIPAGAVLLSRDGRTTGPMLADAVRSAVCASGRDVIDADVAATPTTGVLVRYHQAAGGMQISASHNPSQYNGIKLFNRGGRVVSAEEGQRVLARFERRHLPWVAHEQVGSVNRCPDTLGPHAAAVLSTVDVDRIRDCRFQVLLDSNHGAGGLLGTHLLTRLGCQTTVVGQEPTGRFAHPPEPTADHLQSILSAIPTAAADVGFCQDPDADRLAVIDESGRYLGEEYTLALCLDHVLRQTPGPVVINCATSRMSADLAEQYGVPCFRSAVGEANVVELMQAKGAVFGGEGNGGPIDPRVGLVRDSFVGMALILDAMARSGSKLSALADALPRYDIHKSKVMLDRSKIPAALKALQRHFRDADSDRQDGLRLDWPDKWLLVRASNTEPIVRVIAEAATADQAQRLADQARQVIQNE